MPFLRNPTITPIFSSNFGTQAVPPPSVLKPLPKIFSHNDKTVRAEGTQLTHALYQYLGPGIESFLSDLKPVQVKELKEAWEVMEKDGKGKGTLKPQRLTRTAAREAAEKAEVADADDGGEGTAGGVQGSFVPSLQVFMGLLMIFRRGRSLRPPLRGRRGGYHLQTFCRFVQESRLLQVEGTQGGFGRAFGFTQGLFADKGRAGDRRTSQGIDNKNQR